MFACSSPPSSAGAQSLRGLQSASQLGFPRLGFRPEGRPLSSSPGGGTAWPPQVLLGRFLHLHDKVREAGKSPQAPLLTGSLGSGRAELAISGTVQSVRQGEP